MSLRIGLATAALTLLVANTASADVTQRVVHGGFEDGIDTAAPPWTFAENAMACSADSCFHEPAGGLRYAAAQSGGSIGGQSTVTTGTISQNVLVPVTPATLSFKFKRIHGPDALDMDMKVTLGGVILTTQNSQSDQFQSVSVVLPSGVASPSNQLLEFKVRCSNASDDVKSCDRFDLDEVSLVTGAPPDTPTITGTDPASPADNVTPRVRGTVSGDPTQVSVYPNANCAGTPAATGSPAEFTGAGVPVAVQENATTALSARASNAVGDSGCSNSVSYTEVNPPLIANPATGLTALKSKFVVGNLGVLILGKAANPPTSSTTQTLTFGGASSSATRPKPPLVIGRGKTNIPSGATKSLKLTLNRKGKRLLRKRKKLRARLTIVAKGPTGLADTVTKNVKLVLKRPRR